MNRFYNLCQSGGGGVILQDISKVSDDGDGKPATYRVSLTTSAVIQLVNL